jgi:hypothetical protein
MLDDFPVQFTRISDKRRGYEWIRRLYFNGRGIAAKCA